MRQHKFLYSIALVLCCSLAALADNYVILNQVLYDSPLNEQVNISPADNGEFIELYNAGVHDVALNGWQLKGESPTEVWTFHITDSIKAGGYMIVKAVMVPHPPIALHEVGRGEESKIQNTLDAFHKAAKEIAETKPETVIVLSPHAVMYRD